MNANNQPPSYLRELVETRFRKKTMVWTVPECGLSAAHRFSVSFNDGSKVFVKAATDPQTTVWLHREQLVLAAVQEPLMPRVIDWIEVPGGYPVLLTQDLSAAYWPAGHRGVHWRRGDQEQVFSGLRRLTGLPTIADLPLLPSKQWLLWPELAANPEPFLALELCSERRFRASVAALTAAEALNDESGNHLVHGDMRSDNICFDGQQVVFVDWSHAAQGSARSDLARLLPTLYLEGGPRPATIIPDGGSAAAAACAVHFSRIRHEPMPDWLKTVFVKLVAIELEWAAECLALEKPDGISWQTLG
ncbi:aminoglycoside phosphotransferase family protein [Niabella pedocola]|uniref:Aminoglycoside phosphotransferase family protein n=1 Tax=Niabella pedocola TaxID=1752077 RepID=A0ABS8PNV4_9BACT|nr:phosphotransferase [Niabella pedocola]MCD2422787.1 aminoglycoside phosphotransferase family protein [Niabella pedocola]